MNMYNIGGLIIKIENHDHIPTPKNLELFRVDSIIMIIYMIYMSLII